MLEREETLRSQFINFVIVIEKPLYILIIPIEKPDLVENYILKYY